ncbi:MAG: 5-formyltetrahydrofolate cyclo-ligase [Subdoligranulum sp.]|nr:5-formyltetrahydrofolate cyclo-ligase [Subdoligranulum sp.]MDD7265434.1 5-formyltetrahydrofolate cyclo-ligase [Subdoligranulum sp.]MDY5923785.1 5-formyltetrahydrofolate cyclo-ligase [Oscillospiraceae bacterium]
MQSDDLNAQKQAARRAARQQLAQISPQEFSAIGAAMWQTLQAQPAWQNAESVFCFVGALHEPDTMPILQGALSAGKQLLVPRIAGPGQMQLVPLQSLEQLQPGAFGILEPGQALPAVPAGSGVQLAVLPCLAAARSGARLGHGGGYYDRFLANYSGRRLILCPEALLAQSLPTGPLDEPAQAVLTEKALYGTL